MTGELESGERPSGRFSYARPVGGNAVEAAGKPSYGVAKTLAIAVIVSALIGAAAGFGGASLVGAKTIHHATQNRVFWVFTVVLPFNDSGPGMPPHDYFAPDRITVYQGDNVTIHYFNTEEEPEDHTFTIGAPYNIDKVLPYNTTTTFAFTASTSGIFPYECLYHQPTMTGWLVVLDN